jgi:hypothetical protein
MLVLWFLAAYLLTYVAMGIFNASETGPSNIIRILDVVILLAIFAYIFLSYYSTPSEKRDDKMKNIWSSMYTILNDPYTLLYTGIFLAVFGAITFITHIPISGPGASVSLWLLSTISGILFTITAIVVFCKEVLGISLLDSETFDKLFGKSDSSKDKKDDKSTSTSAKSSTASVKTDEVFNISNNLYTYDDARAVCSAFGARLATYDEIENAYSKGGEWCNYGWSEGQMAFFPTQKSTWDQLQKNPKTKNNCGRPGVNGGYMENPYIKFGVNCFGQKPKATDKDLKSMAANKSLPQAKTADDLLLEKKVKFWKENADKLLQVNSFNRDKWSEY